MDRESLFGLLDIEAPEDFGYFEQFADLVECPDEIEYEDFFQALSKAEPDTMAEIVKNYFEELEKFLPSGSDDIFEIVENVANNLNLIVGEISSSEVRKDFVQKLFTFHEWYTKRDGAAYDGNECSVVEAIFNYRAEKLDNTKHTYDFSNSLEYDFDYISLPIGGFIDDEQYGETAGEND